MSIEAKLLFWSLAVITVLAAIAMVRQIWLDRKWKYFFRRDDPRKVIGATYAVTVVALLLVYVIQMFGSSGVRSAMAALFWLAAASFLAYQAKREWGDVSSRRKALAWCGVALLLAVDRALDKTAISYSFRQAVVFVAILIALWFSFAGGRPGRKTSRKPSL